MTQKRGAKPYPRFDDEICDLLNVQNIIGLSDAELIRKYQAKYGNSESANSIRNKLRLITGCTPEQFAKLKSIIESAKKDWLKKAKRSTPALVA